MSPRGPSPPFRGLTRLAWSVHRYTRPAPKSVLA